MPKINYMTNYKDKNQLNLAFKNEWSDIVLYGFLKIYLPPKNKTKVEILSKILQDFRGVFWDLMCHVTSRGQYSSFTITSLPVSKEKWLFSLIGALWSETSESLTRAPGLNASIIYESASETHVTPSDWRTLTSVLHAPVRNPPISLRRSSNAG